MRGKRWLVVGTTAACLLLAGVVLGVSEVGTEHLSNGPAISLSSPEDGANRGEWPTFIGRAATGSHDLSEVTVRIYAGTSAGGHALQVLTARVAHRGTYAVAASAPLMRGTYTALAEQRDSTGGLGRSAPSTFTVGDPVVLAAGDIASCGSGSVEPSAKRTGRLLLRDPDALVMTLGDNAYDNGQPSEYLSCYDRAWGLAKARTRPVVGSHDEGVVRGGAPPGLGYVTYFADQLAPLGESADDPSKLYYSYELGAWHVVVLNDSCISGLTPYCDEQAQEAWLRRDLAAHTRQCVLAAWHRPLWSSDSVHGDTPSVEAFWDILYRYGADLVLSGSAHDYERFAPQSPDGALDPSHGIREVVVGTGGNQTYARGKRQRNSEVFFSGSYAVLRLTLHPTSYDWRFVPAADGSHDGASFTDSGSTACHRAPRVGAYRTAVLASGPVSYWRLGDLTATLARDLLGRNPGAYHGVLLNQPGALAGDPDASASFDGTDSYVQVPPSSGLNMTHAVTVELWAKRAATSNRFEVVLGKPGDGQSRNENYAVWLTPSNRFIAYFGDGHEYVAVQTPPVVDKNWHYVVATNDGTTAKIYLDGVMKEAAAMTIPLTANNKPLNLGRPNAGSRYFFNGSLDEVAVYPTALSAAAIVLHYASGTTSSLRSSG